MRRCLALLGLITLSGCVGGRAEAEARHRQATIDVAAGIFEAADAVEKGAPSGLALQAIKIAAMAIIQTQGGTWPRGERWLEQLRQKPASGDQP